MLLPAAELTGYTERSDFAYQETVAFSLAPAQAIGLLTPGFFGRGPALHWGLWERVELPYAGVATLLMAAAALLLASVRTRRQLWPWVGMGLFGLATALGIYAIVHGWLTALLPMFDQFRAPARAVVLWTFAVAVLGAVGVDLVARQGLAAADASCPTGGAARRAARGRIDPGRRRAAARLSGAAADAGERDGLLAHVGGGAGSDAGGRVLAGDVGARGRARGGLVVADGRFARTDGGLAVL